ncbi:hypothetical protein, partial [Nostoc sp. UCD121]|uniref:hypothetical protein n=1 Tax=Nostoc sp. UCD121 TaxID=2681305 RepID=UPI001C8A0C85
IVDGALRSATTHPTLKFLNIAGNISTDLLSFYGKNSLSNSESKDESDYRTVAILNPSHLFTQHCFADYSPANHS